MVPGGPALVSNAPSAVVPTVPKATGNHWCGCCCPPTARNLSLAQLQAWRWAKAQNQVTVYMS